MVVMLVHEGARWLCFFFFQAEDGIRDLTVTGVQTCALPIFGGEKCADSGCFAAPCPRSECGSRNQFLRRSDAERRSETAGGFHRRTHPAQLDRKSTRLNSSHSQISYAVFCLKKKTTHYNPRD